MSSLSYRTPPRTPSRFRNTVLRYAPRAAAYAAGALARYGARQATTYAQNRLSQMLSKKGKKKSRAEHVQEQDETQIAPGSVWTDSFVKLKMAGKKGNPPPKGKKDLGGWIYNHQFYANLNSSAAQQQLGCCEYTPFAPMFTAAQIFAPTGIVTPTFLADDVWSQSLWGNDPDASLTGAPATGQGGIGTGPVVVGNTSSTAALSGATYIKHIYGEFVFTNYAPGGCEFTLYWLTPKVLTDQRPDVVLDQAATFVRMGVGAGTAHTIATQGQPGAADVVLNAATAGRKNNATLGYGMTPFMFKTFNEHWKVLQKSDHVLQSANSKKIKFKISYNKLVDYQKMWAKSGNDSTASLDFYNGLIPGYTVIPFVKIQGPPVFESATATLGEQQTVGYADLRMNGFYNVFGRHCAGTSSRSPTTVRTDSQILSGVTNTVIAAVGAAPVAYNITPL